MFLNFHTAQHISWCLAIPDQHFKIFKRLRKFLFGFLKDVLNENRVWVYNCVTCFNCKTCFTIKLQFLLHFRNTTLKYGVTGSRMSRTRREEIKTETFLALELSMKPFLLVLFRTHFCLLSPHRSGHWVPPAWTPNSNGTEWRSGSGSPGPSGDRIRGRKTVEQATVC